MSSLDSRALPIFLGEDFREGYCEVDALLEKAEGIFTKPKPYEVKDWMKRYDKAIKEAYDKGFKVAKAKGYPESQDYFRIDCYIHFARIVAKQKRQQLAFGDTVYDNGIKMAQDSFHHRLHKRAAIFSPDSCALAIFLGGAFYEGYLVVKALLEKADEVKDWMEYDKAIKEAYDEGFKVAKDEGYPESQAYFRSDCDVHFAMIVAKQKRQQHAFEVGDTVYDNGIKMAKDSFHQALDALEKEWEAKRKAIQKAYKDQCVESCTSAYRAACDAGFKGSLDEFKAMCKAKCIIEASHTK